MVINGRSDGMDSLESDLIMGIKSGDQESCTALFELYGKKIYNLAYRMCGSKEDAEDILQQTFMQAYQSIGGFRLESGIYTWLYAIARNNCLRLLENRKKSSPAMLDSLVNSVKPQIDEDAYTSVERA
jgi:RNA polymerase sigma-70 factor (ECF subfamily)